MPEGILWGPEQDANGQNGYWIDEVDAAGGVLDTIRAYFVSARLEAQVRNAGDRGVWVHFDRIQVVGGQVAQNLRPPQSEFHTPLFHYEFVPKPPRKAGPLGDAAPPTRGGLGADRWSGSIAIQLETESPLLLVDASRGRHVQNHWTFPTVIKRNGRPEIPISTLKGALRSAVEMVTASRYSVFPKEPRANPIDYPPPNNHDHWPSSPWDIATAMGITPATDPDQMSPADRMFGWVSQEGEDTVSARASRIRISRVLLHEEPNVGAAVVSNMPAKPLKILSSPKPVAARFYTHGGYIQEATLNGAKIYPATLHPDHPHVDNDKHVHHAANNQNRSVGEWVATGCTFRARIDVFDCPLAELGALIYVLHDRVIRLGGAKPLGFGSVKCNIRADATHLIPSEGWKDTWSLDPSPVENVNGLVARATTAFKNALNQLVGVDEAHRVLAAYNWAIML